ncbi:MAG: methionyl-tRNA formyltransferase [Bacteroidales bacterium]|nr:methionyl-tRNA formyltransferase [Candidatus Cryptobacteroides aphodequi]
MKRLDRFILKSFIGPFVAILLVVVFILMMQFLWLYIDELVGKGLAFKVIAEFMMWGSFTILPLALPLATLLASMMTLGSMAENNELMAIKAAGISLIRVMVPLTVVSAIIAVGAFFAGNNLVPKAYNEIYTLRDDISRTKEEIKIPSGTFYEGIEGYVLRVNDQNDEGMLYGVMVYDHTGGKGNTSITIADSATMKLSKSKDYLVFTLYDGINYQETNTKSGREYERELQKFQFADQQLIISLKNYSFEKSEENRFGNQIKSRNIASLDAEYDSLVIVNARVLDEHYEKVFNSNVISYKKQLDTAFVREGKLEFDFDGKDTWKDRSAKIRALKSASEKAQRFSNEVEVFSRETYVDDYYIRHTRVEILKRIAQALACFILFFIGAPLGALIGKGGIGVSAIVSVLFFVLYWVIDISGTKLANDGAVGPAVGAFISSYVLFPIGCLLTWKAVHDSTFFNMESFKTWWKKITSKIAGLFRKTRIVYMGTPEFAVAPLDALVKAKYNVVGVVTVADKPSGRGLKLNESAVKKYAVEHGIPVLQPVKLKDPEFLASLRALKADMFVVVAFRMLPEEVWAMPKLGTFNLHAALLPQYRGAAPINWAVINGERITGATTFMIDKNIDTGGIILRQECRISPEDTAGTVHDRLMEIGTDLVLQTVEGIIQKNVETRTQRSFIQGQEVLKPAPKLTPELLHIDWNDTTDNIYNLIRGLSPYPTAYTTISQNGQEPVQLKIFAARKAEGIHAATGTISVTPEGLAIATADGAVVVTDLQLSGKKRMEASSFLRGFRNPEEWKAVGGSSAAELRRVREI